MHGLAAGFGRRRVKSATGLNAKASFAFFRDWRGGLGALAGVGGESFAGGPLVQALQALALILRATDQFRQLDPLQPTRDVPRGRQRSPELQLAADARYQPLELEQSAER